MKKIIQAILCSSLITLIACNPSNEQIKPSHTEQKKEKTHIIHTYQEEKKWAPVISNGSLGDAIHNTSDFLNYLIKNKQGNAVFFSKNKENLDTVIGYEKSAIKYANEVNASMDIKQTLKEALSKTEEGILNQDINVLNDVNRSLLALDSSYGNE